MTENLAHEHDLSALEREVADIIHWYEWDRMTYTINGMGTSSSDYHGRTQRLDRIGEIAKLIGQDAVDRAKEGGFQRYRDEVAGHLRGRVPDDTVNALVADDYSVREKYVVIRGLRSALLDKDIFDVIVREEGDDWLDASVARDRELVAHLERCK